MDLWPHQAFCVEEFMRLVHEGETRICCTSPTGGGKSKIIEQLVLWQLESGRGAAVYTNRKLLFDQLVHDFEAAGIGFGKRAADHVRAQHHPLQLCSIQTEYSRVFKRGVWQRHDAGLVVIDEAHVQNTKQANAVINGHLADGAVLAGFTATPLGLSGRYDKLIVAGVQSELRACGALVPAVHFGCDEPDLKNIKSYKIGEELTEKDHVKAIMLPGIHGRVIDKFRQLNPTGRPSIGFAPGVRESIGFAEAFEEAGIPAAHIDGDEVWIRGVRHPSDEKTRAEVQRLSKSGAVKIVWNRYVLREGINMPWLAHGVLACIFGTLQGYLQSCGRLLRAYPGLKSVVLQDHGGNWWRHGSVNDDRIWNLDFTGSMLSQMRLDEYDPSDGEPKKPEPFACFRCKGILVMQAGNRSGQVICPHCGAVNDFTRRSRPVIQTDGELVEHPGNIFRKRRVDNRPDTAKLWEKQYWRARNSKSMTFKQAIGLFCHENGYYPPKTLPMMPTEAKDWYLPVKNVPKDRLRPKEPNPEHPI